MTITEHIAAVRREMAEAARESGRSERDIFLVGASKMNDAAACQEASPPEWTLWGRTGCRR